MHYIYIYIYIYICYIIYYIYIYIHIYNATSWLPTRATRLGAQGPGT